MSGDELYMRRATDRKLLDIEAMIADENDPKQRSFLICLNSINVSLVANTRATSDLSRKFEEHLTKFEEKVTADDALLNQGRGMWKVIALTVGVIQAVAFAMALRLSNDLSALHTAIDSLHDVDAQHETRLGKLEQK